MSDLKKPGAEPLVRLDTVGRCFTEGTTRRVVLEGVSARIERGESVALLGRSGSGKSTLLNLVAGIDLPDVGRVFVDGVELNGMGERERTLFRRRNIGFVYQFFNLIPTLTVTENVRLPAELTGMRGRAARGRAEELLDLVGLAERGRDFPDHLSGGEQQRVAIARALSHHPALVLADEPTGHLDEETGTRVAELLRRAVREHGTTLLVVTHSRDLVVITDRVVVLEHGHRVTCAGASG